MIQEDYCSFKVAKLLKEKGFNNDYPKGDCIRIACTHQMAMAWLREVHDIIIVVEPHSYDYVNSKTSSYVFCLWYGDNYEEPYSNQHSNVRGVAYNSFEEAVEAALKYSLENLV